MGVTARIMDKIKIDSFVACVITDRQSNGYDIVK